jgi:hypothetical protein
VLDQSTPYPLAFSSAILHEHAAGLSEFFLYWRFTMLVSIVKVSDSFINLHIVICPTAVILLFSYLLPVTIAGFGVWFAVSLDWFW